MKSITSFCCLILLIFIIPKSTSASKLKFTNIGGKNKADVNIGIEATIDTPLAKAATMVTETSFEANWSPSGGATRYYPDVATNAGFITILGDYNDLDVGNVTSFRVSNLIGRTTYFYRVRAYNGPEKN